MLAYTYMEKGRFELIEKTKPVLLHPQDAIVRVTLSSICSSDLHIKHGSVPRLSPVSPSDMRWWALWKKWAAK